MTTLFEDGSFIIQGCLPFMPCYGDWLVPMFSILIAWNLVFGGWLLVLKIQIFFIRRKIRKLQEATK